MAAAVTAYSDHMKAVGNSVEHKDRTTPQHPAKGVCLGGHQ